MPTEIENQLRQVRHWLRTGQLDQAKELCLSLIPMDPASHETFRLLGLILHGQGQLTAAGEYFAEAIRLAPGNAIYHYNHAMILIEQGETAAAIAPLQRTLLMRPDFAEAHIALGNIAMMGQRPDQAVTHYAAALKSEHHAKAAYYNLAMAYTQLGFWQSAVPALEKAAALPPQEARSYRQLGDFLSHHSRLPEAVQAYSKACAISPDDTESLEKLGDLSILLDDYPGAIAYYRRVTTLQPDNCKALNNLGLALQQQGHTGEAIATYQQALAINSGFAELHYNLANALMGLRQREEAASHYQQAIRLRPAYLDAWFNLGVSLQKLKRYSDATQAYGQVLAIDPANREALFNLALTQQAEQHFDEAITNYTELLALDCGHVPAQYNLGIALNESGRLAEAVASFERAHALAPEDIRVLNNLGLALHDLGRLEAAVSTFQKALQLKPDFAEAMANLGNTYLLQGREEEAAGCYRQALTWDPKFSKAYYNLGCLFLQRNEPDGAVSMFRQAIALEPLLVEAHWNISHALLLRGDLVEGFKEYRWRWRRKGADRLVLPLPEWHGERSPEATLLVVTEQGKGDSIQFARYLRLVKPLVGRIVLACETSLRGLMASMPEIDTAIFKHEIPGYCAEAHYYAPLLNLPETLGTTLSSIPSAVPYLHAEKSRSAELTTLFQPFRGLFKVGLAWQGNPLHKNDHNRSCPPEVLLPLADLPGVALFCLQKTSSSAAIPLPGAVDLSPYMESFADTAALMDHLDLVIAVDTAPLHLAGALGRQVWGLLPVVPDWRWMLAREDTPWYPTMRLFRQSEARSWAEVIARVRTELLFLLDSSPQRAQQGR